MAVYEKSSAQLRKEPQYPAYLPTLTQALRALCSLLDIEDRLFVNRFPYRAQVPRSLAHEQDFPLVTGPGLDYFVPFASPRAGLPVGDWPRAGLIYQTKDHDIISSVANFSMKKIFRCFPLRRSLLVKHVRVGAVSRTCLS